MSCFAVAVAHARLQVPDEGQEGADEATWTAEDLAAAYNHIRTLGKISNAFCLSPEAVQQLPKANRDGLNFLRCAEYGKVFTFSFFTLAFPPLVVEHVVDKVRARCASLAYFWFARTRNLFASVLAISYALHA